MKITPVATRFDLPLPIYKTVQIADAASQTDEEFTVYAGLSEDMVAQVRERSLDDTDEALKITSDRKRFGEGNYKDWYAKSRMPFALVHKQSGKLAAIAWYGPKPLGRKPIKELSADELKQNERELAADNWVTFTYRSYPPFRGKGLMKEFVRFTMDIYAEHSPGAKFWGGLYADNTPSLALAHDLGFSVNEEASDHAHNWLVVTKG
jgi:RimJ/RimL family protein N-acetyltransferase